jgi:ABC-type Mn2+/Zn2+ transport system ATPase subunit
MGPAFIFQITDLTKKFGQRELLKNINLAFYPGAKIGLLGRNGAGKSTLMKIMAGIDKEYDGETRLADGYTVGYLRQEPQLDPETRWIIPVPCCAASRRSMPGWANRSTTPRWRNCSPSRRRCRTRSTSRISGTSTGRWRSRWTR